MNAEFEALKLKLKQKLDNAGKKTTTFNTDIYPFWNMNFGDEAVIRILRDSNSDNENVFYVEKCIHTLSISGKDRNITCIEKHFNTKCPICELSRKYYAAKDKDTGIYYYNKKKYLLKAIVIKDPLPVDTETKENSEGKVRTFQMNKKLIDKILLEMSSDQLEAPPWDFKEGYDFIIKKTKGDGGHAEYMMGSQFARKSTIVPQALVDSLEPVNLTALLPTNPTLEKVQQQLNSHLTGDDSGDTGHEEENVPSTPEVSTKISTPVVEAKVETKAETKAESKVEEKTSALDDDDDVIFQRIVKRKQAEAAAAEAAKAKT